MKFFNKTIYALSIVGMMGLWSCSQDDFMPDSPDVAEGHQVKVTITVSRGEDGTRTVLSENYSNGGLKDEWVFTGENKDELYVYNANNVKIGTLQLQELVKPNVGVFSGDVTLTSDQEEVAIWYYDKDVANNPNLSFGRYSGNDVLVLDLKNQSFADVAALSKVNVLSKKVTLKKTGNGNEATVIQDEVLRAYLSFARFNLKNIPTGTKGKLNIYNIAAKGTNSDGTYYNTYHTFKFNLGGSSVAVRHSDKEDIIVNNVVGGQDVYVAFVSCPGTEDGKEPEKVYQLGFKFTAENGDVYTYEFEKQTALWAGRYYNSFLKNVGAETGTISGVVLEMEKEVTEEPAPNPADMGNWGANGLNIDPKGVPFSPVFASEVDGWTNNIRSLYNYGGWCRAIEYTNGMINGLMTSKGGTCFYYQWGRFLGFPTVAATGNETILNASLINVRVGYLGGGGIPVKYLAAYMGNSSSYNVQRSNDWAIVYGQTNNGYRDYIYNNTNNENWYSRSSNPAPTGYRIPTMEELSVFIPSTEEVNGSYAEVKTVNGEKYAVKWVVGTQSGYKYVDVTSVKTTASSVSASSSIFSNENAKTVRIYAYGYMMDNGVQSDQKTKGLYWSSDSGNQDAFKLNDGTKGGRALYLEFENNKAVICELCPPFGFGAPVMLIKDDTMVETTIKPWLPYSWEFKNLPGYK